MDVKQKYIVEYALIGAIVLLALFAVGMYIFGGKGMKQENGKVMLEQNQEYDVADTSNWKTYRNEEYGFEVKYPLGCEIEEPEEEYKEINEITLCFKTDEREQNIGVIILKKINVDDLSVGGIEEVADLLKGKPKKYFDPDKYFLLDNNEAIQIRIMAYNPPPQEFSTPPLRASWRVGLQKDTIIQQGNFYFIFGLFGSTPSLADELEKIYDTMLPTFKFISSPELGTNERKDQTCEDLVDEAAQYYEPYKEGEFAYQRQDIIRECSKYLNKFCATNQECGSFPCHEGVCLIRVCNKNNQCPSLCGLYATPVPRFCTTIDIK